MWIIWHKDLVYFNIVVNENYFDHNDGDVFLTDLSLSKSQEICFHSKLTTLFCLMNYSPLPR